MRKTLRVRAMAVALVCSATLTALTVSIDGYRITIKDAIGSTGSHGAERLRAQRRYGSGVRVDHAAASF